MAQKLFFGIGTVLIVLFLALGNARDYVAQQTEICSQTATASVAYANQEEKSEKTNCGTIRFASMILGLNQISNALEVDNDLPPCEKNPTLDNNVQWRNCSPR